MTLCRRGRSVFSLTLVRGLVAILLIGGAALDSGTDGWPPALFCTFAALRSIRDGWLACRPRLFHGPAIPAEEAASVVNVHIHQFRPGGAVVDAAALASEASGQRATSI